MKKLIIAVLFIMMVVPASALAWSSSSFNIGFAGGSGRHGGGSALAVGYSHSSIRHGGSRRIHRGGIRHGGIHRGGIHRGGIHRGSRSMRIASRNHYRGSYYGGHGGYRSYRRPIHRQAGRVYYQGSCGAPVIVVPSGGMHGGGCGGGCRY